jgi:hypothetical protein
MDTQPTREKFDITNPWLLIGGFLLAAILAGSYLGISGKVHNPVPRNLRQSVSFPVYYPDEHKLPKGFVLNESSFKTAQKGVIIFSIGQAGGQRLIISEEARPSDSTINDFIKNYTPLHSTVSTKLGQAQFGAFGNPPNIRTIVSLPINKGPWLIITAPTTISQDDIKQILQSLKK